jgi:hypothetical protein
MAIGFCERQLTVLHHYESCAWHLPVGHGIDGKTIKFGD